MICFSFHGLPVFTATEISQLNISAGGLERELHALRAEESGLSDGMRSVEEVVRVGREERERESSSRLAHLHSEIIRLKRELEVLPSAHTLLYSHMVWVQWVQWGLA